MQVSNINTTIIDNNGLSNITNHTSKQSLINHGSIPWNGSVLNTTEAKAQLKFLEKIIDSVNQDGGKKIAKREVTEGYLKMTICGNEKSNHDLSVSVSGEQVHIRAQLSGNNEGDNTQILRYTHYDINHDEKLQLTADYTFGPSFFQKVHAEDKFSLHCKDGRPFLEAGEKERQVLFSSGCNHQERKTCKNYNEWQPSPDTGSNCTIL